MANGKDNLRTFNKQSPNSTMGVSPEQERDPRPTGPSADRGCGPAPSGMNNPVCGLCCSCIMINSFFFSGPSFSCTYGWRSTSDDGTPICDGSCEICHANGGAWQEGGGCNNESGSDWAQWCPTEADGWDSCFDLIGCNDPTACNFVADSAVSDSFNECTYKAADECECGKVNDECGVCGGTCFKLLDENGNATDDWNDLCMACGCNGLEAACASSGNGGNGNTYSSNSEDSGYCCNCEGWMWDDCGQCVENGPAGGIQLYDWADGANEGENCDCDITQAGMINTLKWRCDGECVVQETSNGRDVCGKCGGDGPCPCGGIADNAGELLQVSQCVCCNCFEPDSCEPPFCDDDQDGICDYILNANGDAVSHDSCVVNQNSSQTCGCNVGVPADQCNCNSILGTTYNGTNIGSVITTGNTNPYKENICGDCFDAVLESGKQTIYSCAVWQEALGYDEWDLPNIPGYCDCDYNKCDTCGVCGGNNQCRETCMGSFSCNSLDVDDWRCSKPACSGVFWSINTDSWAYLYNTRAEGGEGLRGEWPFDGQNYEQFKRGQKERIELCNVPYYGAFDEFGPGGESWYPMHWSIHEIPDNWLAAYSEGFLESTWVKPLSTWGGTTSYGCWAYGYWVGANDITCKPFMADHMPGHSACNSGYPSYTWQSGCNPSYARPIVSSHDSSCPEPDCSNSLPYGCYYPNAKMAQYYATAPSSAWQRIGCADEAYASDAHYKPICWAGQPRGDGLTMEDTLCVDIHDSKCCRGEDSAFGQCYITRQCQGPGDCSSTRISSMNYEAAKVMCEINYEPLGCYWDLGAYDASAVDDLDPIYTEGDLNNDGFINILDIVVLADCILSNDCYNVYGYEADYNDDNNFNVMDIITLCNIILQRGNATPNDKAQIQEILGMVTNIQPNSREEKNILQTIQRQYGKPGTSTGLSSRPVPRTQPKPTNRQQPNRQNGNKDRLIDDIIRLQNKKRR